MKRSAFKPKPKSTPRQAQDREARLAERAARTMAAATPRAAVIGGATGAAVAKFDYVRSPELLRACREIPCQHCGRDDGSVVAAHSNSQRHGKGRGIKASDIYVASLCYSCHMAIDQGRQSGNERVAIWDKAHAKTVRELVARGLWPAALQIPDIRRMN